MVNSQGQIQAVDGRKSTQDEGGKSMKEKTKQRLGLAMLVIGTLMVFNGVGSMDVGLAVLPHSLCSFAGIGLIAIGGIMSDLFD